MDVFVSELLNLHRGQGQEILWRDRAICPTEHQYNSMVLDKTGGLFRLAVGLMAAFEDEPPPAAGAPAAGAPAAAAPDYTALLDKLALYFQIRDDYINLLSEDYMKSKSFCEDLTEGKFSFPIIHAVRARPDDTRLLNILKQRTEDVHIKRHAVDFMRSAGSFSTASITAPSATRIRVRLGCMVPGFSTSRPMSGWVALPPLATSRVAPPASSRISCGPTPPEDTSPSRV